MRRLSTSGTVPTIVPSGSTDVLRQIEDIIRGIQSDIGQVIVGYNEDVYPIISSFPQGRSETRWSLSDDIYPKKNGVDGSQVFLDNEASLSIEDGRYWRSDLSRPKTIKESIEDLYSNLSDSIDSIRGDFASVSSYGVPARAVGMIGDNIFDASRSSSLSSLDGLTQKSSLDITQLGKDLYGATWSLDGDGSSNLGYSVQEMVNALLTLHGGIWNTDIALDHGSAGGTPLVIEDTGVVIDSNTVNVNFTGTGVVVSQIAAGEIEVAIGGGSSTDVYGPAIIVGNSVAGDTLSNCHYLDTGNCSQLAAAITAAGVGVCKDVFVRRGTYDLDVVGAPVTPIAIPAGVRVRGAGRSVTTISTRTTGDGGAFYLGAEGSSLEDLRIYCPTPTAAQAGSYGIVEVDKNQCELRCVDIEFENYWATIGDPWWRNIDSGLYVHSAMDTFRLIDCRFINVPHLVMLGGAIFNGVYITSVANLEIHRLFIDGGDYGLYVAASGLILDGFVLNMFEHYGLYLGSSSGSNISSGRMTSQGESYGVGLSLDNSSEVGISNIYLNGNGDGDIAVWLSNADRCVLQALCGDGSWDGTSFMTIEATSGSNVVALCQANGDGIIDFGAGNDLAHNMA